MPTPKRRNENTERPSTSATPSQEAVERFRQLSHELLTYSTAGLLRRVFLPMVSERIMEHAGCDAVELWVKEDPNKHFRCAITKSERMPHGFILVPCALGEETSESHSPADEWSMEKLCCSIVKGMIDDSNPRVTARGSYWIGDTSANLEDTDYAQGPSASFPTVCPFPYESIAIMPIRLEADCIGILQLKSRTAGFFTARDVSFYEDVSETLGVALSHQYAQIELRERIKELTCLYGIARVIGRPDASFDEIMQGIVELLPAAWLFPEIAQARIVLNGKSFTTSGYRGAPSRQVSDIVIENEKIGFVEVVYLERRLTLDEGPFLAEERSLIDSVAREVAIYVERARAEEERASLHEQLRHADRLATIGQLAAGVAHELNEPLGNILGFAQLAKKSTGLPTQVKQDLTSIETASLHAREIIRKLMTFARQLPAKKTLVNLNDIVRDGIYFFESRCAKAGIHLVCRLADDLPMITVDPGQINQVLVNLVVNAIHAMPEGGTLIVETRGGEDGIDVSVEDSGAGISDDVADQIFLPFFTTKDINEGTGLGLAVVHGIVTSHGGTVKMKTEVGKGTRFMIHLPFSNPQGSDERRE